MNAAKKEFPPSRTGRSVANRLAERYRDTAPIADQEQTEPAPPSATPPATQADNSQVSARQDPPAKTDTGRRTKRTPTERARDLGMVTRSWYLPSDVAAELDAAAAELAAVPGVTKHQALTALIEAGLRQKATVRTELIAGLQNQLANF